ncbi:MAG: DUF1667 domain-containing protein [Bilifractor sp.]|jgi:CxxC motif-containing protein
MKKQIICTVCPNGCRIDAEGTEDKIISLTGNKCKRGEVYATNEFFHPVRILTTTMKTTSKEHPLIPVRSKEPIPKEKMMDAMKEIRKTVAKTPIHTYDVLIEDICGTGIPIVATGDLE